MPRVQPNTDENVASRVEGSLLLAVGVAFLAYAVAQWFDAITYRPPAVVYFAVAVGLLLWGGSLLWRSERASTDHPIEKRDV